MSEEGEKPIGDNIDKELPSPATWRKVSIKRALKLHIKDKDKGKNHKCPFCEKELSNNSDLTEHKKTYHENCQAKRKKSIK